MPPEALDNIILLTICYSVRNITKIAKFVTMQGRRQRGGGSLGARVPLFSGDFFLVKSRLDYQPLYGKMSPQDRKPDSRKRRKSSLSKKQP